MAIKSMPETDVYVEDGHLCIRQKDSLGGDDAVVFFPRELCAVIASRLLELATDESCWESGLDYVTEMNLRVAKDIARNTEIINKMNLDASKRKR